MREHTFITSRTTSTPPRREIRHGINITDSQSSVWYIWLSVGRRRMAEAPVIGAIAVKVLVEQMAADRCCAMHVVHLMYAIPRKCQRYQEAYDADKRGKRAKQKLDAFGLHDE
jgi:hypothetical protein